MMLGRVMQVVNLCCPAMDKMTFRLAALFMQQ
jgi:hypothetical protein